MKVTVHVFHVVSLFIVGIVFLNEIHVSVLKIFEIPYQEIPQEE